MNTHSRIEQFGRASLLSVMLTAIGITVNHVYTLGTGALLLGAALLTLAVGLFTWFRRTGSALALAGYALMNAWIVVGFGAIKGLWDVTLPVFAGTLLSSVSTAYPKPVFGTFGFEISGVLMFLGSLFVLYYGLQLVPTRRHRVWLDALLSGRRVPRLRQSLSPSPQPIETCGLRRRTASSRSASSCRPKDRMRCWAIRSSRRSRWPTMI